MLLIDSLSDKVAKDIGLDLTSAYKEEHLIPLNLLIIARFSLPSKLGLIGIFRLSRRPSKSKKELEFKLATSKSSSSELSSQVEKTVEENKAFSLKFFDLSTALNKKESELFDVLKEKVSELANAIKATTSVANYNLEYYDSGFEGFNAQAARAFPELDFSKILSKDDPPSAN
ncbi:unnamed protein product [Ilex paraguariensis]|uniref:Uncharacterized protein n=1 Tax=Ilex paraguariensis TaxID=185542 RepID=A0ABC8TRM7_9AQUA